MARGRQNEKPRYEEMSQRATDKQSMTGRDWDRSQNPKTEGETDIYIQIEREHQGHNVRQMEERALTTNPQQTKTKID